MPTSTASVARELPIAPNPTPSPPAIPQQPLATLRNDNKNAHAGQRQGEERDSDHASLLNEIRRLERSMSGALRASRDEMESLEDAASDKRAKLRRMEEELAAITNTVEENSGRVQKQQKKQPSARHRRQRSNPLHLSLSQSIASNSSNRRTYSTSDSRARPTVRHSSFLRRVSAPGAFCRSRLNDEESEISRESRRTEPALPSQLSTLVLRRVSAAEDSLIIGRVRGEKGVGAGRKDSRCVSGSGKRNFFGRSRLKDEKSDIRESLSRRTGPVPSPSMPAAFFRPSLIASDSLDSVGSNRVKEQGGGGLGSQNSLDHQTRIRSGDNYDNRSRVKSDSNDYNNNSINNEEEETDGDLIYHQRKLEAKKAQLEKLQKRHQSNANHLSYLQSKLLSIQTSYRLRLEKHTSTIEAMQSRKQTLSKSIERKERLITDVQWCVEWHEGMVGALEQEIENLRQSKASRLVEEEVRKYQLRLKIHSQYTAKAIRSFVNIIDMAKKKDTDGVLLNDKNQHQNPEGDADKEEKRQQLVEEIALDVDIQLNALDKMVKDVGEKVEKYKLRSSSEIIVHGNNGNRDDHNHQLLHHSNQLLQLSKEYADDLSDFVSTISKTVEMAIGTMPHSVSIECWPASSTSPPNYEMASAESDATPNITNGNALHRRDDSTSITSSEGNHQFQNDNTEQQDEMPYFKTQRKKIHLHELQRSQLQADTNIYLLQNAIGSFRAAMQDEKCAHWEMMSDLQCKLQLLRERLERGGMGIQGLVKELEQSQQKEDELVRKLHLRKDNNK